ncbi:MAG: GCN5-related N-acetyltransferase [Herbinix sp.]|jgi:ribosomal protein S18 acetylase RimI-like enzyme|nr:GCN5-related N-acetyltransferase [Herbinix sp.]
MSISYGNSFTVVEYNSLRRAVGWNEINERQAVIGLSNSKYKAAAYDGERTVGMARLITDGGYVAYIADVVVHPDYQKLGIGRALLQMILTYIEDNLAEDESVCVILMAAKDKEVFYKSFGFKERPTENLGAGMSRWISGKAQE